MSTILKALRKIEDDTGRNDGIPAWPGPVQLKNQADARLRNKQKRKQMILAFIVLILVFSFAWTYSLQPVNIPNPVEEAHPPVAMVMNPEKGQAPKDSHQPKPFRETSRTTQPKDAEPKIPKTARHSEPFSRAMKPDLSQVGRPPIADVAETQTKPKVASVEHNSVQNGSHRLDEKRDPRINLQAIAWAPEPENSFAVINNRILREDQSFDGITITHIGKDDVSFREMGREWRETFRIK